jgi:hypothetical protein
VLVFCDVLDGNVLALGEARGEAAVVDSFHEQPFVCWRRSVVAPSLEAWLAAAFDAALRGETPLYWYTSPALQAAQRDCLSEVRRARG